MKKHLLLALLLFITAPLWASHVIGGEMFYEFLSANPTARTKTYRISLRLFRDAHCFNCADMPVRVFVGIFNNDTRAQFRGPLPYFDLQLVDAIEGEVDIVQPTCILNAPDLEYHYATYVIESVVLPDNESGYTASYQTCCRVAPLENVANDPDGRRGDGTGSTYACFIPGTAALTQNGINSSPQFKNSISTICQGRKFSLNFGATDTDNDELRYSFSAAYNSGAVQDPNPVNPAPPPYGSVQYINGFSAASPLGNGATINPTTGVISGIAPPLGDYIVSVDVSEYRNGKKIGLHRKDFIVNVSDCDVAGASLRPGYIACDGFDYTFENLNNSPLNKTYLWDFGDGTFSREAIPTHRFSDTGTFKVRLLVNENNECGETDSSIIRVFPGFVPQFSYSECANDPTKFKDQTVARYGDVNSWQWRFGQEGDGNDTATVKNPIYRYPTPGRKLVSFIVSSTKGCVDTVTRDILILGNAAAGKDTTIVAGQQLQLQASEGTRHVWTPATDLSNSGIQNPIGVYRGNYDSIRYKVVIYNEPNCVDSAFITVRVFKTAPSIFVPTAFSPNGDGRNDVLRATAAGISRFEYFRVYNRWGQEVFATNSDRQAWDGTVKGRLQSTGTFVWMVKGVDFLGKVYFQKGTVTLIR